MAEEVRNQNVNDQCFVCGTDNPMGLHAQFVEDERTGEVVGMFVGRPEYNSYPGRLHGGVASAMLDETIGRAFTVGRPDTWGVTMRLETRYHRPTPLGETLYCRARITRETRRTFEGEGTLETADGTVCVSGKATYLKLGVDQILEQTDSSGSYVWEPDEREIPEAVAQSLEEGDE